VNYFEGPTGILLRIWTYALALAGVWPYIYCNLLLY